MDTLGHFLEFPKDSITLVTLNMLVKQ